MTRAATARVPLLVALVLLAGRAGADEADPAARALALLDAERQAAGPLALTAILHLGGGEASRPDLLPATLTLRLAAGTAAGGQLDLAVVLASFDDEPRLLRLRERLPPAAAGAAPLLRLLLEVPEEVDRVVAAVTIDGQWGAAEAQLAGPDEPPVSTPALAEWDLRPSREPPAPAPVLRLLPPLAEPVTGPTRIRALVSDPAVAAVRFELDGEPVAEDGAPPFAAVVDLGAEAAPRELVAVAYDAAGGRLGEDRLTINRRAPGSRLRIAAVTAGDGTVGVTAELELAGAVAVRALEFYLNAERLARLTAPPWRAELPRPEPGAGDFVRVVALLADGAEIEDARLVDAAGERVEVNLVQVFAVVTDRDGAPRRDLAREEFELRLDGRRQPIERFAPAEDVPLVLGLVIDTSGSMWPLMPDTRVAGSRFLAQALRPGDRAFLVDFDTRPRLAAALTADLGSLLERFSGLVAEGYTALYDAVIFSMLQFERQQQRGRRALVVLTDGDDYRSRFGARRCIEYGRELGVPVYIIALGGMFGERRDVQKLELDSLAGSTGGRVFYIGGGDELGPAYDRIQEELRSQYLLAFTTPRPLAPEELAAIRVRVRPRGLRVRWVVGAD